jgi:hypothetical protein
LLVFTKGASGNTAPVAKITSLARPSGIVADAQNNIWATYTSYQSISEFAPNANGNATPLATIAGSNTNLDGPMYLVIH